MLQKRRLLLAGLIILLSSCSYNSTTTSCEDNEALKPLPATADFTALGTLVIAADNQKNKANFFWQQTKQQYKIGILGPLGISLAEITGDSSHEQIKVTNEDESYNLKEFMLSRLGYYISPIILRGALLGGISKDVEITKISYGCVHDYRVPTKIKLQLAKSDTMLDLRITDWQL